MDTTPRHTVSALEVDRQLAHGLDERFTGYGAMGVPYSSGHYLALRDMVASSVGPAYRAIWHRDDTGRWTIYTTAEPHLSCPRYFGSLTAVEQVPDIAVSWQDDWTVDVTMGERLSWRMGLGATAATRTLTSMGGALPETAWNSTLVLAAMGPMAGGMLGCGRIRLRGMTPDGPSFKAAPLHVWRVVSGHAEVDGTSLGELGPLAEQARLGDFYLPQRGLFFAGRSRFSATDPATRTTAGHDTIERNPS
ncbi:MAG: hypothetical protein ABIQ61_00880 [Ornithinibacter sp.]